MSIIRIIGIGSPFGDDRIGWDAIDALEKQGVLARLPAGTVESHCCATPIGLLSLLQDISAVILIDAMRSGAAPGTIRKINAGELVPDAEKLSGHTIGVAECLALARELDLLPHLLILYAVEIADAAAAPGVGDRVQAALPELVREITSELGALSCGFLSSGRTHPMHIKNM